MLKTSWTKEQVEELIQRENLAYQKIELPYGLVTAGRDRAETSAKIFTDDIKGKSVLDIGCFLGYFCHEAIRRGASRVVGVDVDENRLRQARLVAECLGMPIEFKLLDIEEEEPPGQFDVTLMLNVLHHLHDPIAVLDKVIAHTRERLILEIAGPTSSSRARRLLKLMGASWWTRRRLERLPLIVVGRGWGASKGNEQKFFFAPSAMNHLLMDQRGMFSRLELKGSNFKNRYIATAWKRRVDHLIIISGATASGKSTLIKQLIQAELPEIAGEIGMDNRDNWIKSDAVVLRKMNAEKVQNMIYHYHLLRPWGKEARTYRREQGIDILDCARRRTVVTLWCDPEVMYQRAEPKLARRKYPWHLRRIRKVLALYRNGEQLAKQYEKWIAYCRQKAAQLFFVDCTHEPKLLTRAQWEQKVENLKGA